MAISKAHPDSTTTTTTARKVVFKTQDGVPTIQSFKEPTFATVAEERLHRKQRLAAALRIFSRFGYEEGLMGHMSARDPEDPNLFWINPFGVHFSQVKVSNLLLVNHQGEVLEGNHMIGRAAYAIHSAVHDARPEVVAAAHSHALHGRAWASLGRQLDPITQDACPFYRDHVVYEEYHGVTFGSTEGERIAKALGKNKAIIMKNHGTMTVGRTVDEAAYWYILLERACQVQLMAEAAGKPIPMSDESAALTYEQIGNARYGWASFQPLYDWITKEEPDTLE